jgi:hypothetical protein
MLHKALPLSSHNRSYQKTERAILARSVRRWMRHTRMSFTLAFLVSAAFAQDSPSTPPVNVSPAASPAVQLPVNWLYGAYVPRNAPLVALNGSQRLRLYISARPIRHREFTSRQDSSLFTIRSRTPPRHGAMESQALASGWVPTKRQILFRILLLRWGRLPWGGSRATIAAAATEPGNAPAMPLFAILLPMTAPRLLLDRRLCPTPRHLVRALSAQPGIPTIQPSL